MHLLRSYKTPISVDSKFMKYIHHDTFFYFLLPFSYFPLNIHHLVRDVGYLPHREGSNACASGELK